MAYSQDLIKLAQSLPPRLIRFFARYPPPAILPAISTATSSRNTPITDLNSAPPTHQVALEGEDGLPYPNPFKFQKNTTTGKWHDPVFSLRRQAELVKLAREHGVEELLPHTVKGTQERFQKRLENGLRLKGTGVGQRVKGKLSERTLKGRLEKRRQAMLDMPQMIKAWKERGHGRGWKKWPK